MYSVFKKSHDLRFLTFKSLTEDKFQKISKLSDRLRLVSDSYYIVREANKITPGYHFHALVVLKKEPPKSWYRKGVHIHLQKVGKPPEDGKQRKPEKLSMETTEKQLYDMECHEPEKARVIRDNLIFDRLVDSARKIIKYKDNVRTIIRYMEKEQKEYVQYENYVLCVHKKMKKLDRGGSADADQRPAPPEQGVDDRAVDRVPA